MSLIDDIIGRHGIEKLNSATKYPSIMTYHALGEKGALREELVEGLDFSPYSACYITEKIDGTNARIIYDGEDYLIGSREELLYAKGDRIGNPQMNIVNTVKEIAEKLEKPVYDEFWVLFGEVYGGNVTAASKQYTADKTFGFRMFDFASIDLTIFEEPLERISSWREHGGQKYLNTAMLTMFAENYGIATVPYLAEVNGTDIPADLASARQFLRQFAETKAGINKHGKAEGIVVRNFDRSLIRKLRFEDYEKAASRAR